MFLSRCIHAIRTLGRDTSGASIVFVAAAIVPLLAFIGLGTDAARGYLVKARLSQALDAAGLAGAQNATDATKLQEDIQMFFNSNFPAGFLGSTTTGPTYAFDSVNDKLVVSASAIVPTTFMRVLGFENVTVSATTEVTRKTQYLDVVLAMDVSTSMSWAAGGGQTRIQATKASANILVDILYGTAESKPLLKMGLVPWNSKVNVTDNGTTFTTVLPPESVPQFTNPLTGSNQTVIYRVNNSAVPFLSAPPASWKGCVYARYLNDGIANNDADIVEDTLSSAQGDWIAWEPIGPEGEPVSGSAECSMVPDPDPYSGGDCRPCSVSGITRLNQSKTTIQNAINDLVPNGQTNIPQGLAWAWRALTPTGVFQEAELTPDGPRVQAIVLLTDGQNWGGYGDAYKAIWFGEGNSNLNDRLLAVAANIKATGVIIYVIQFYEGDLGLQALLKQVATEPDAPYYHFAPDPSSLDAVFTEIANHLSELRLSK